MIVLIFFNTKIFIDKAFVRGKRFFIRIQSEAECFAGVNKSAGRSLEYPVNGF